MKYSQLTNEKIEAQRSYMVYGRHTIDGAGITSFAFKARCLDFSKMMGIRYT